MDFFIIFGITWILYYIFGGFGKPYHRKQPKQCVNEASQHKGKVIILSDYRKRKY